MIFVYRKQVWSEDEIGSLPGRPPSTLLLQASLYLTSLYNAIECVATILYCRRQRSVLHARSCVSSLDRYRLRMGGKVMRAWGLGLWRCNRSKSAALLYFGHGERMRLEGTNVLLNDRCDPVYTGMGSSKFGALSYSCYYPRRIVDHFKNVDRVGIQPILSISETRVSG